MILKRDIISRLLEWNDTKTKSPLVLFGARQVGKTTLLKTLASRIGKRTIEINFWRDRNGRLKRLFQRSGDAVEILAEIRDMFS